MRSAGSDRMPRIAPSLEIPSVNWFNEDVVEALRRDAVREAGTMTLDGRE